MLQNPYVIGLIFTGVAALLALIGFLAMRRRVRELHSALDRVRRDCEEMSSIYANAPTGLAMLDGDLRYVRINKLLAQLNGVPVDDHLGKSIGEIIPEVARQAEQSFMQVLRTGKPLVGIVFEGTTPADPGVHRYWRENIYPIFADDGTVTGVNVAAEDITEERRLNDALRASETRERQRAAELEAVMNATPAGIFISHDRACLHITGNAEATRLLRLAPGASASASAPSKAPSRTFSEFMNGEPAIPSELPMQRSVATGQEIRGVEVDFRFDDGHVLHTMVNASPLRDEAGNITGAVGAFVDISAYKRLTQMLVQEGRHKDRFIATLAHELRNPLAAIQSGLELMKLAPAGSPALPSAREVMERQLSHLIHLIDDLLDVSRISTGKLELKKRRIDLRQSLEDALAAGRRRIEGYGHVLKVELPSQPVQVDGDPVRLSQVVTNLLDNAAKYTPEGGRVRLSLAVEGESAIISVVDSGIGIEPEAFTRLFDIFSQLESGRTHRKGGMGVGLALSRQIVELHGGTVGGWSDGSGKGSTFEVRLPLAEGAAHAHEDAAHGDAQLAPKRVLVIDDNADAARMLGELLRLSGHTVRLGYTGREAIDKAHEFMPDVALLDLGLPDISGFELARMLRADERFRNTRLVALTGWGSASDREESRSAGFDGHLTKPATGNALRQLLHEIESSRAGGGAGG